MIEEARKRLIFALDVPDRKEAERYVKLLEGSVGCFKVGLELFVKEGPEVLKVVRDNSSADIFLDLKLHDIPATLSRALISAASHKVKYVTIHLEEGEALRGIPPEVKDSGLEVLAVTVLTSISEEDLSRYSLENIEEKKKNRFTGSEVYGLSKLENIVIERAMQAEVSGCAGVICSGEEVKLIKSVFPHMKTVVPGIRPAWSEVGKDDQSRITTPGQAIERGADLIVVGRPIRDAQDPKEAADRIVDEILQSLNKK
ncbi:MAG: orotidine-5'-phosphate decarboxylase [Nitrospinae bacterium]|nr:orotidine-5'-phosphate decarboxylase [Nitrospinota bacterium]MDA1109153.1 orotidine-5'-phosphate decarboxylase [Nitrospinota bacterium]